MILKKHFIFLNLLLLTLSACGFHLRGQLTPAKPLQHIYIQTRDPYGELARNIKQYLRMSNVQIASSPQKASTILNITQDTTSQELISINGSQQTRQYNLKLSVTFEVLDAKGRVRIPLQTIHETRPLTLQSNQVLAGSNQATQLYHDMRQSIIYSIMARLASKEATQAVLTP